MYICHQIFDIVIISVSTFQCKIFKVCYAINNWKRTVIEVKQFSKILIIFKLSKQGLLDFMQCSTKLGGEIKILNVEKYQMLQKVLKVIKF